MKRMQQPYVIGIDIGTGSTKGVAVTHSGSVLASAQVHYQTAVTNPFFSEQDPEVIWQAFVATLQKISMQLQQPPAAVSLSSCMHSLILMDASAHPLTPNITWADRRSAAIADTLRQAPEGEALYRATGMPLHAMSPLCKIAWFYKNEPATFQKAAYFISIKEYIWYKLFSVYEVDYSIACATGLFDITNNHWFQPALAFCGIKASQLSFPVVTDYMRTGLPEAIASLLHLPPGVPFCIGASDGCLANVGSSALQEGTAAVTIGTSGAVRVASAQPVLKFPEMIFNYRLDDHLFVCGGAVNNGGNMVQWLLNQFLNTALSGAAAYESLFRLTAEVPAGSAGLICLPYLNGERAPLWNEETCGVFFGFRPQHRNAHFVRAALEGVCFALYDVLKTLEEQAGFIHTLHVSGGMVHSQFWMQLLADVTGKKLCLLQTEDASAVGAALLGFKAIGLSGNYLPAGDTAVKTIKPNSANHAVYTSQFSFFKELYAAVKTTMQHLHHFNS